MAAVGGPPRLLALRALGLGDLLTGVPALRALADAFPDHRRMLACPRELAPLVELTGAIDEVLDARPLAPLADVPHGVELAVNLHGRGPESHRVLQALEPRRLIAFVNPAAGFGDGPRWVPDEHERLRWCRLLEESGVPADPGRLDLRSPSTPVAARLRGSTVVHPGAAAEARRWPAERYAAVARAEAEAGRQVVVTGSRSEAGLARQVADLAGLPGEAALAGQTELLELAALVGAAGRVVCGDTGIAHLATALRTPSVVLFGPVAPQLWGPPDRPWHRVLWAGEPADPHAGEPGDGLLAIAVDDVLAALADLPAATAGRAAVA